MTRTLLVRVCAAIAMVMPGPTLATLGGNGPSDSVAENGYPDLRRSLPPGDTTDIQQSVDVLHTVSPAAACLQITTEETDRKSGGPTSPAVIMRAVKLHGGKEGLLRLRTAEVTFHIKGECFPVVAGKELESINLQVREIYNLPHQIRKSMKGTFRATGMDNDQSINLTWAINGAQAWVREAEGPVDILKGKSAPADEQFRPLMSFELLARHDTFTWTSVEDLRPDEKDTLIAQQAVEPKRPGTGIIFFFNKKTGLLHRVRTPSALTSPFMFGEVEFSSFQDIEGVTLPMQQRILMNGKQLAEIRITQIRFLNKVDPSVFEPPVKEKSLSDRLSAYLTPKGELRYRLILRDEGGFAGRGTGVRWQIEPDGAWERVSRDGADFSRSEGRLDVHQLRKLAVELARYDLLTLPRDVFRKPGEVVADGFNVAILFGKHRTVLNARRGFADLPAVDLDTAAGRFAGVVRAVQQSIAAVSPK